MELLCIKVFKNQNKAKCMQAAKMKGDFNLLEGKETIYCECNAVYRYYYFFQRTSLKESWNLLGFRQNQNIFYCV